MDVVNRTFVGIRLPDAAIQQIEQNVMLIKRKPGVGDVRWNPPREILITLTPFGEIGLETIARLRTVLRPVCERFAPMTINVQGFSGIPSALQPRYAAANLTGDTDRLAVLEEALWQAASPVLGPREGRKPFQPHIVVGRLKTESESLRVSLGRALKTAEQPLMGVIHIQAIELLASNAGPNGIDYMVLDQFPLRGI